MVEKWKARGKPIPPPHAAKLTILRDYAGRFHLKVFVETGTYFGDTLDSLKGEFDKLYSIELNKSLHKMAQRRFRSEADHIELIQGDSGDQLAHVMAKINQPTLFWLDAHFNEGLNAREDSPILRELEPIFAAKDFGHIILIDDARWFGIAPEYPRLEKLEWYVNSTGKKRTITVEDDCIRIVPA